MKTHLELQKYHFSKMFYLFFMQLSHSPCNIILVNILLLEKQCTIQALKVLKVIITSLVFLQDQASAAIRSYSNLGFFNKRKHKMKFYGFDSFDGFGENIKDDHPFFVDDHFDVDFKD